MIVTITTVCKLCGNRHNFQGRVYGDWEGDDALIDPEDCNVCKKLNEIAPKVYKFYLDSFNEHKKNRNWKATWGQKYSDLKIEAGL